MGHQEEDPCQRSVQFRRGLSWPASGQHGAEGVTDLSRAKHHDMVLATGP
jgi:hypothetical protein